jgi:hypothetical protein
MKQGCGIQLPRLRYLDSAILIRECSALWCASNQPIARHGKHPLGPQQARFLELLNPPIRLSTALVLGKKLPHDMFHQ